MRSDGLYPDSFFLSGCLEPLFLRWVPFPCIRLLLLSVSFVLMHILQSHNHRYTVSHDVLHLCIVSVFCMSYLVCDAFQDAWCVLSYFGNFHCMDVSHSKTIKLKLPHFWCTASILFHYDDDGPFHWNTFNWCGSWLYCLHLFLCHVLRYFCFNSLCFAKCFCSILFV